MVKVLHSSPAEGMFPPVLVAPVGGGIVGGAGEILSWTGLLLWFLLVTGGRLISWPSDGPTFNIWFTAHTMVNIVTFLTESMFLVLIVSVLVFHPLLSLLSSSDMLQLWLPPLHLSLSYMNPSTSHTMERSSSPDAAQLKEASWPWITLASEGGMVMLAGSVGTTDSMKSCIV